MTMLDNFRLIAEKVVVWLPDLLVAEAVGQSSIVIYGLAVVSLYIQGLNEYLDGRQSGEESFRSC